MIPWFVFLVSTSSNILKTSFCLTSLCRDLWKDVRWRVFHTKTFPSWPPFEHRSWWHHRGTSLEMAADEQVPYANRAEPSTSRSKQDFWRMPCKYSTSDPLFKPFSISTVGNFIILIRLVHLQNGTSHLESCQRPCFVIYVSCRNWKHLRLESSPTCRAKLKHGR